MAELPGPMELLDLQDKESISFRVVRFEEGTTIIKTQEEPEGKEVDVLRIHVPSDTKPTFPPYWDITSKLLRAALLPHLKSPTGIRRTFSVTAHGVRPRKRFSLQVV